MSQPLIIPRAIRLRDAPHYLGMDRNRFNRLVRPHLTEIRYGKQSLAFDRLELDAWFEAYKFAHGQLPEQTLAFPEPTYRQRALRSPSTAAPSPATEGARAKQRFEAAIKGALSKKRK